MNSFLADFCDNRRQPRPNYVVLTGAPGSGKSQTLLRLGELGHLVLPESYRWMRVLESIETFKPIERSGNNDIPDTHAVHLGLELFRDDIDIQTQIRFVDRSMIDIWSYVMLAFGQAKARHLLPFARRTATRVLAAFSVELVGNLNYGDWLRQETQSEARRIADALLAGYRSFGIHIGT